MLRFLQFKQASRLTYIIDLNRLWEGTAKPNTKEPQRGLKGFGRVSVVLVARGHFDLFRSLKTVMSQPFLREVIIVDLGLSAYLRRALEQYTQENTRCHIITGRENMGAAHAYNLGSHYCSGDYLFFMTEKALLPKNILARALAFARHKSVPSVIGFSNHHSQSHWFGKLTHFQTIHAGQKTATGAFEHAAKIGDEGIFVSTRVFALLKGMDEACFNEALAWDFSLRTHYAGGDVYQANSLRIEYQAPAVSIRWIQNRRLQWQNYRGWRYFLDKYVSRKTHFMMKIGSHAFLLLKVLAGKL